MFLICASIRTSNTCMSFACRAWMARWRWRVTPHGQYLHPPLATNHLCIQFRLSRAIDFTLNHLQASIYVDTNYNPSHHKINPPPFLWTRKCLPGDRKANSRSVVFVSIFSPPFPTWIWKIEVSKQTSINWLPESLFRVLFSLNGRINNSGFYLVFSIHRKISLMFAGKNTERLP